MKTKLYLGAAIGAAFMVVAVDFASYFLSRLVDGFFVLFLLYMLFLREKAKKNT